MQIHLPDQMQIILTVLRKPVDVISEQSLFVEATPVLFAVLFLV